MSLDLVYTGKVRDIFNAGDGLLLMVASDRVSAFDYVFFTPIPQKGRVLTAMTSFWSDRLRRLASTHLVSTNPSDFPPDTKDWDIAGRAMLVRRAEMLPIECIVRGYLSGSAWKEYKATGTMHGAPLPAGLAEACRLPEPAFTPSTKATSGHDENISFERACELVGEDIARRAREISLAAYEEAAATALEHGVIVADTKFELGLIDGELAICDEILTPDSSRLWAVESWREGSTPPSFDKQPLRDWVVATGWDMNSSPPPIPDEIVAETSARYVAAYERTTGLDFSGWWGSGGES
ncbi:MAG TPA: phosphoribosylaminoimidazolesuccinocarboxamide synthase [Acidimicrobiales bacterium]|nr:phosphoribosylaminoimidazolesuccinocarboxamide synthase [Acidimicrobiales bacterium]